MGVNYFKMLPGMIHENMRSNMETNESKIVFGKVVSVDPLSIEIENGRILPSRHFYLTDNVIVKKVRMIVHRMYGQPEEILFEGKSDEVSNALNSLIFNLKGETEKFDLHFTALEGSSGGKVLAPLQEYGIAGKGFARWLTMLDGTTTLSMPELSSRKLMEIFRYALKFKDKNLSTEFHDFTFEYLNQDRLAFHIEFIEKEENKPEIDKPEQKQTTRIEGIIWEGLKVDDVVMLTSHNHNQKYLVHSIINREREDEDYQQAQYWNNRINDVPDVDTIERHR